MSAAATNHRCLDDFTARGALKIQNGFPCGNWNDKGIGVLQLRPFNVTNGGQIDLSSVKFIETDKKLENYLLRDGDVIFNNTNSEALVGKTAYWAGSESAVLSNHMTILRVLDQEALSGQFLAFYLLLKWYDGHFHSICQRHVNQASVGKDRLGATVLPPIELPEQKKIAHILSTVQRAIEAQERIIQTTTELKKALMHKLFTEGLRNEPQKKTEIGPVPESWEVVPLSECAVVQTGIAKGRKVNAEEAVEVPYLRVANVQDGYLDLSEMKTITIRKNEQSRFALQKGDVVLTEGGDFDKLGRGFIWHGQIDNCVHQNHVFAVRPDTERISSEFFAYQSQSPYGKSYFLSVAHKTTNLACINTTKLKAFPVLLPPQDQQEDIVEACSSIDGKIRNATNKKTQLQDLFRTLLHELMTAKTRVHELEFPSRGHAA
ncbi:MAG: restriction endonuclease subunit S [Rhizobiales bacterium]|nr:restriction endonuclease subunit S [Hyphomicrobiales bacterium]